MWVLAFGPKRTFETMILAECSTFRKRKFLFLRFRRLQQLVARNSAVTKQRTTADLRATINVLK